MSYLKKAKATCGRYAKRPDEKDSSINYEDETSMSTQDQLDNLKAKISLKIKYNKAIGEDMLQYNVGATLMLEELNHENSQLREDLQLAKIAEKLAIKKALRSHRFFYLACAEKSAEGVINWLDDKIFDLSKTLNEGVYMLKNMKTRIHEAEKQVIYLEKCPVPGTEPWERKMEEDRVNLECAIEARKANKDAASILNNRYKDIFFQLRGDRGKWPHAMNLMENNYDALRKELNSLEQMLEDAIRLREETREKLAWIEEEASANRKQRRQQMSKMKKAVEKALMERYDLGREVRTKETLHVHSSVPLTSIQNLIQQRNQEIKAKQTHVAEYEDKVQKLVQAMRVHDLRGCPTRLTNVRKVCTTLTKELEMKENLRDLLIDHKFRMELIMYHFRYTGCQREEEHEEKVAEKDKLLQNAEEENILRMRETNQDGVVLSEIRYGLIGLEEVLHEGKKKSPPKDKLEPLTRIMGRVMNKLKPLVESVKNLREMFDKKKTSRQYSHYVKYTIPTRYSRVGASDELDIDLDSDPDLEIVDSNIPSREELKQKSIKIVQQGKLRRGIRD